MCMRGLFLVLILPLVSSCGYHMRGESRPFFEQNKIQRLYVSPVRNNSYKSGVEITVYNALRKRFSQGGYLKLVDQASLADAEFSSTVIDAKYVPQSLTTADKLAGLVGPSSVQVATNYNASLKIQFILKTPVKTLWEDTIERTKIFAASNYIGPLGSTSALLNEGEFERTLNDLSLNVATDAEESINTIF